MIQTDRCRSIKRETYKLNTVVKIEKKDNYGRPSTVFVLSSPFPSLPLLYFFFFTLILPDFHLVHHLILERGGGGGGRGGKAGGEATETSGFLGQYQATSELRLTR